MTLEHIKHEVSCFLLSWIHLAYYLSALLSTSNKHLSNVKATTTIHPSAPCAPSRLLSHSTSRLLPTLLSVRGCENSKHRHLSYCTQGRKRCRTGERKLLSSLTPAFTDCTGRKGGQFFLFKSASEWLGNTPLPKAPFCYFSQE